MIRRQCERTVNEFAQSVGAGASERLQLMSARAGKRGRDSWFKDRFNFAETPQSWTEKGCVRPQTITSGMFGYSLLRANQNREFFKVLMVDATSLLWALDTKRMRAFLLATAFCNNMRVD
jgi:hypothetical protein